MNEWLLAAIVSIQPNGAALLALRVSLQPNAVDVTTVRFLGAVRHAILLFLCEESEGRVWSPPHRLLLLLPCWP